MRSRGLLMILLVGAGGCAAPLAASTPGAPGVQESVSSRVLRAGGDVCFIEEEKAPDPNRPVGERVQVTHLR